MPTVVSIVKCEDYSERRVYEATARAIELAGLSAALFGGQRVLIKPNLLSARLPEEAVTTHPTLVSAVGQLAIASGCEVSVGDSPPFAGENEAKYAKLCERTGIADVAIKLGIPLLRFEEEAVQAANPSGRMYHSFDIAAAVARADIIANIPKLKTHGLTAFSGAVKNVFGCIPGIRKGLYHVQSAENPEVFAQMLVDLLALVKPTLNVMDAVIGMEGEGPNAGNPRQIGLILASSDPVALDAVACTIVGIDPMSIHTTRLAHEQGLGCGDLANIQIAGETIEDVIVSGFRQSSGNSDWARIPAPIKKALRKQLIASPMVKSTECTGCGDCVRACPVHVITAGHPPTIDLTNCIRCYCCHEVCNLSAIKLQRGWLGNLAFKIMGTNSITKTRN